MLDDYKNPSDALPDMDYFTVYPSPMFEAMFNQHISTVNTTTTYYGPFLYWLCRCTSAIIAIETGLAQCWSSFFLASGVHDEGVRHGVQGKFYGIDVADKSSYFDKMKERGITGSKFIKADALTWLREQTEVQKGMADIIFIDDWHEDDHVRAETEAAYPLLKGSGEGYIVYHDTLAWCEKIIKEIINDPRYQWEHISFTQNYGLTVLRKMEGYDYNKINWPTGCQKKEEGIIN